MLSPESALLASRLRTAPSAEALRRYAQLESVSLIDLQGTPARSNGAGAARPEPLPLPVQVDSVPRRGTCEPTVGAGSRASTP